MTEYIEREQAYQIAKLIVDYIHSDKYHPVNLGAVIMDMIDDIPSADVIPAPTTTFISGLVIEGEPTEYKPVVRCKKCANWARADGEVYGSCSLDALIRNEDFWCANGVKDDDGEDVEGWTELNTMTITGMK